MGRRSEQRIAISFPVIVRGIDSRGAPFVVTTETADISCTGALLKGLEGVAEPGGKVEIESQNQRAWYRIQWAHIDKRTKEWRVGVRCLEPGKYIWGIPPLSWKPDTYDPAAPEPAEPAPSALKHATTVAPQQERRKFARYPCRLETHVTAQGAYSRVTLNGKITDISLGGCYVEMLAPLPEGTLIDISFSAEGRTMQLSGRVCCPQDGFGMGVAFTGMTPEDYERLRKFAPPMVPLPKRLAAPQPHSPLPARMPAAVPPLLPPASRPSPQTFHLDLDELPATPQTLSALLRVLLRKGVLTRTELLEELEKHKATRT